MKIVSIDGASRRPGKPDCTTLGLSLAKLEDKYVGNQKFELESTSQRGELNGLLEATRLIMALSFEEAEDDFYLITDSEYLYNALSKEWYKNWERKGWTKADGTELQHKEAWITITASLGSLEAAGIEVTPYHIKGHVVSVGKATAKKLIEADGDLMQLRKFVEDKFIVDTTKKPEVYQNAKDVFVKNHGFLPPLEIFKEMIILNTITDTVAGYYIDKLDATRNSQC